MDSHAPVTLAKLRTATHAQPLCISPRNGKRLLRYVNAHAACTPPFVQCCKQQRARTRPEIKYAPRSVPAEMLHCGLQQCFGVRAGDKNGGRNLKSHGPEIAGADDIGNRFPVHATPHTSDERRVCKEWCSSGRYRWAQG